LTESHKHKEVEYVPVEPVELPEDERAEIEAISKVENDDYDEGASKVDWMKTRNRLRKWVFPTVVIVCIAWLIFVGGLIGLSALGKLTISDVILAKLIGTIKYPFLALTGVVLQVLFPNVLSKAKDKISQLVSN